METSIKRLYPNLYILLVAPPGVGKSVAIEAAKELIVRVGKVRLGPSSVTKAALVDIMKEAQKAIKSKDGLELDFISPVAFMSSEFGTLIPDHNLAMLNTLNDLYDCGPKFSERTRSGGVTEFDNPCLNMIAGTQPKYLASLMPEEAWSMGYTSRIIMIYAGEKVQTDFFDAPESTSAELRKSLISDLRQICDLNGEFTWTDEAKTKIRQWQKEQFQPAPDHSRLQHYLPRRPTQAMKLAMIFSASRSDSMIVSEEDIIRGIDELLRAEEYMPEIFKDMVVTNNYETLEETYRFIYRRATSTGREVPEASLVNFLMTRVPANMIDYTVNAMLRSGVLVATEGQVPGQRTFKTGKVPNPREL